MGVNWIQELGSEAIASGLLVAVLGTLIVLWIVEPIRIRIIYKVLDILIGEKLEELPEKREAKVILIADGIDDLLDNLEKHRKALSEETAQADVRPYQPIKLIDPPDHIRKDIINDYTSFEEHLSDYNHLITQYQNTRSETKESISQHLLDSQKHVFRTISNIGNINDAWDYADTVLDGIIPRTRAGGMSKNQNAIYLLIPGFRSEEKFEEYFKNLDDMADNIMELNRDLQGNLEDVRSQYVSLYDIDEVEIEQKKSD